MIHQQKAHDLSYLEPDEEGRGLIRRVPRPLAAKAYFVKFYGRVLVFDSLTSLKVWRSPDNATPLIFLSVKSQDRGLSADVLFVPVLAMVLS